MDFLQEWCSGGGGGQPSPGQAVAIPRERELLGRLSRRRDTLVWSSPPHDPLSVLERGTQHQLRVRPILVLTPLPSLRSGEGGLNLSYGVRPEEQGAPASFRTRSRRGRPSGRPITLVVHGTLLSTCTLMLCGEGERRQHIASAPRAPHDCPARISRVDVGRAAAVHRARLPVGLALLLALGLPSPACGQVYLGLDAALTSPYVWRGVTRANGWVVQPECFTSVRTGDGFLSGGAWASYETPPRQPRRPVGSRPWPARARRAGLLGAGELVARSDAGGAWSDPLYVSRNGSYRRPYPGG